jgi:eukaryotic-like serine/threonine-protein kinase
MDQLVGQSIGRYQIITLLGQGGMGAVYLGRDITLQRDVAIKMMHLHMASQPGFQERFLQEARTAARLDHPGIVKVYDFGKSDSQLYIVMEFISGANLGHILKDLRAKNQWLLLPEAVQLVRQVALALDYAHKHGVLHRDLKPDNIMLKQEGGDDLHYIPVITDLGLAKLNEGGLETQTGISLGTPAYMSPEQALGKPVEPYSDVYSLGVLLFELTTGQLPFPIKNLGEAIISHTQHNPPLPRSIQPQISEALESIILKAMYKDPAHRFPDAASLASALEQAFPKAVPAEQPATTFAEAVSLITLVSQSPPVERGMDILRDFGDPPRSDQDQVQMLLKDKSTRLFPFKMNRLTIGRDSDNDVVLTDQKTSRHHARIEFDGKSFRVIDLNSTNGSFLDNVKLLPGVAEIWTPDKPLLIGETWFRLLRIGEIESEAGSKPIPPDEKVEVLSGRQVRRGRIGVHLEEDFFEVEPGQIVSITAILINQGPLVEHLKGTVDGIPSSWVVSPELVQLMPGTQQSIIFNISPPRSPQSLANNYPIKVRITSQDSPDQTAAADAVLIVSPYSQFTSTMHPKKFKAGKAARIKVDNQGNAEQVFAVNWQDPAAELTFISAESQLKTPAGKTGTVEFRALPRERRWLGGSRTHTFIAEVARPGSESQTHTGELISRGIIPPWLLVLLLLLCLLLAGAAFTFLPRFMDFDGDGLNYTEETNLGTNPRLADTDGDGLSDGDEVKKYGTLPLDMDSDKDTIPDGTEVASNCTSPNNPDTDGDGIPDNVDPYPCLQPTPTPPPTHTPEPTLTPTPTETPFPTWAVCPGIYPTRLQVGDRAMVTSDPPKNNRVREDGNLDSEILGELRPGRTMVIIDGWKCENNMIWWKIQALDVDLTGWTSEGDAENYWLEPVP